MAFEKILFPTDFSDGADRALEHAIRLVNIQKGEVIVQHVVRDYFEKHPHWATLFDVHETQKYMDMYIDREMARAIPGNAPNGVRFRQVVSQGKPAAAIVELAEKERVGLVLMGPTKGTVTGSVVRASSRPVLTIPSNGAAANLPDTISKVLVTTDLSRHSKKVVDYAFELKQLFGWEVYLLHAIELADTIRFGIRQGHFSDAPSKLRKWAENQLKNFTPDPFVTDPRVHRLVEEGPASATIAACADAHAVDLVILGAHGYGPVEKHFVGTTADKVLNQLSRPVLTVKI